MSSGTPDLWLPTQFTPVPLLLGDRGTLYMNRLPRVSMFVSNIEDSWLKSSPQLWQFYNISYTEPLSSWNKRKSSKLRLSLSLARGTMTSTTRAAACGRSGGPGRRKRCWILHGGEERWCGRVDGRRRH